MVAGGCRVVVTAAVEVPAAVEVVARALGFGHAAAEAVGLGRKHEAAARGAVPVAGAAGRSGALAVAAAAAPAAAEAAIAALLIVLAPGAGWGGRQRGDIWDNGTSFGTFFRASARRLFVARRNRVRGGEIWGTRVAPSRRRPRVWARRSGSSWTWTRTRFRIRWGTTSRQASRWRSLRLGNLLHRGHLPRLRRRSRPCRPRGR